MDWPIEPGDYKVLSYESPIAVCTLDNEIQLDTLGVSVFGRNRTENLGVERIVVNVIANPNIRFLVVCGREVCGHNSGQTIVALHKNGVDARGRVVGSNGAIPIIQNIPLEFVERFRKQVEVVDLIGVEDCRIIEKKVRELAGRDSKPFNGPPIDFSEFLSEPVEVESVPSSGELLPIAPEIDVSFDPQTGRIP